MNAVPIDPSATVDSLAPKGGPPRSSAEGSSSFVRLRDLTGQKFGRLTVVSLTCTGVRTYWKCRCTCGAEKNIRMDALVLGRTLSCGCLGRENRHRPGFKDLIGKRFGRLRILSRAGTRQPPRWNAVCDCGTSTVVCSQHLLRGDTQSCGCYGREQIYKAHFNPRLTEEDRARQRRGSVPFQKMSAINKIVRKRDGLKCLACGASHCLLHVHHLEPWAVAKELRFDPTNLVTLCGPCHDQFHQLYGKGADLTDFEEYLND